MTDLYREIREQQAFNGWSKAPGLQESRSEQITVQVTQLNLHLCDEAQQLLRQAVSEWGTDIAIKANPYRVPAGNGNWVADGGDMDDG